MENTYFHSCSKNFLAASLLLIKNGADIYIKNDDDKDGLDNLDINTKIVLIDSYKKEWNWRRRKDFVIFLQQNKYLCNKKNINNIETNQIVNKVFIIKELDYIITSYL